MAVLDDTLKDVQYHIGLYGLFRTSHCKKYLGVLPRFTKKKVALSPPVHTLAVSFGNVLVAFGSVW